MSNKTLVELEETLQNNKCNDRLALIYQWIKNDVINLKQFKHLLTIVHKQELNDRRYDELE